MNAEATSASTIQTSGSQPSRRGFAMMLMIVSSIGISFGGLIVRNIEAADPWQINIYRSLALSTVILVILYSQYRGQTVSRIRGIGQSGVWAGAILSVAGIAFMQALTHTTVANTMFTLSAIPFITAGLARLFLKEGLTRLTLVSMIIAATGVFIMVVDGFGLGSVFGNLMALVTAACFSAFAVIVRSNRHIDMLPALLVSGLFIFIVAVASSIDDLSVTLNDLLLCVLWGGILSGIGNWMFIVASRYLVAAELTLFMLLEFALSPLWVWQFIGEVPTNWTFVGGLIVISSVVARTIIELQKAGRPLRRGRLSPM